MNKGGNSCITTSLRFPLPPTAEFLLKTILQATLCPSTPAEDILTFPFAPFSPLKLSLFPLSSSQQDAGVLALNSGAPSEISMRQVIQRRPSHWTPYISFPLLHSLILLIPRIHFPHS